ncbi:MAG: NUDIX domain-containing protein [Actinobacteria bacterium]|nr:NUDIX domain-containing protein [Actinomycetota bacterium]
MRRPEEIFVVVYRVNESGVEFLVLQRSPERQGYWHLVAGALELAEEAAPAARRELQEETGLDAQVTDLELRYIYPLDDEPPDVRARFADDVSEVVVTAYLAEAPASWEPSLNEEHVDHRWLSADEAVDLIRYPEPKDAVLHAARLLGVAA